MSTLVLNRVLLTPWPRGHWATPQGLFQEAELPTPYRKAAPRSPRLPGRLPGAPLGRGKPEDSGADSPPCEFSAEPCRVVSLLPAGAGRLRRDANLTPLVVPPPASFKPGASSGRGRGLCAQHPSPELRSHSSESMAPPPPPPAVNANLQVPMPAISSDSSHPVPTCRAGPGDQACHTPPPGRRAL